MARLGRCEYPEITLDEALEIARRIAREFGGSISRAGLAEVLEKSDSGGRFAAVLGGMRMWGLVDGRGTLRVTRDGLRLVSPVGNEEEASLRRKLGSGILLVDEIAGRIGQGSWTPASLTLMLEEITGARRADIESRLGTLERVVAGILPSFRAQRQTYAAAVHDSEPRMAYRADGAGREGRIRLSYSAGTVDLEENLAGVEAVIGLLEVRRRELGG